MRKDQEPKYTKKEALLRPFGLHDSSPMMTALYEKIDRMGTPEAVAEMFKEMSLKLNVVGDTSLWDQTGKAALLMGSHVTGFERFPLLAVFGNMQREDIRSLAMPFTPAAVLGEKIDRKNVGYFMKVIPAPLASDYSKSKIDEFLPLRLLNRDKLLSREEGKKVTNQTLQDAATLLGEGYAINIFPTGNIRHGMETPWKPGIGEIMRRVPEEKRENIAIVPYQFAPDFTRGKLMKAIFYRNNGWKMREETITLHIGQQSPASAIIGEEQDPKVITQVLQAQ